MNVYFNFRSCFDSELISHLLLQYSDLEKEKTMLELELKDSLARHKTEVSEKLTRITQVYVLFRIGMTLLVIFRDVKMELRVRSNINNRNITV